jgi:hypothetical protein
VEVRSDFGIIGIDFENMQEVVPNADGSIENKIVLLCIGRILQSFFQVMENFVFLSFYLFLPILRQVSLNLLLKQRLIVRMVELVDFYLCHE